MLKKRTLQQPNIQNFGFNCITNIIQSLILAFQINYNIINNGANMIQYF